MLRRLDSTLENHGPGRLVPPPASLVLTLIMLLPLPVGAVRPVSCPIALVAGDGNAGFRDGGFTSAYFNKPMGLAASPDGRRLFVADTGNNRIRVVHLDQDNLVTTLAGQQAPGKEDGPLASSRFNQPRGIAYLPGDRLVVNDFGNQILRLIDLKTGRVSTLKGVECPSQLAGRAMGPPGTPSPSPSAALSVTPVSMGGVWDMVYLPATHSLVFSQPGNGTLKSLDLKTGRVSVIVDGRQRVHPGALCVAGDKLYVADRDLPRVFQCDCRAGFPPALQPFAATTSVLLSMGGNADALYAIQASSQFPLLRLSSNPVPVMFGSIWGDFLKDPGAWLTSFAPPNPGEPIRFAVDPLDPRKLYLVNPQANIVSSFQDSLGPWFAGDPVESDYPARKPPRTFRVLLVGDSRSFMIIDNPFKSTPSGSTRFSRRRGLAKRMELELNSMAALEDAPMDFQVISLGHPTASFPLFLWPYYEVPGWVQNNDIDLVLILQPKTPFGVFPLDAYFNRPLTRQGIPVNNMDFEYLLRPPQDRIPDGEPRRFFDLCKSRKRVGLEGRNIVFSDSLKRAHDGGLSIQDADDPELFDSLVNLMGKPLGLLGRKLSGMRTSAGKPVRLLLCFTPTTNFWPCPEEAAIWRAVAGRFDLPYLDLSAEMKALRLSYFPTAEIGGSDHLTADGHFFLGWLLAHVLIRDGLVPWSRDSHRPKAQPHPAAQNTE